jgi:hypothetical protein
MMKLQQTPGLFLRCPSALSILMVAIIASHALGQFATIINVPPDPAPGSIGSNTQVNLFDGGVLPSSLGASLHVGDPNGSSTNVEVNILGGEVGELFNANDGSVVNISGGSVGDFFFARNSTVNISGGRVGRGEFFDPQAYSFWASGSKVNVSGGSIDGGFVADGDSVVNIRGGSVGPGFDAYGVINISGGTVGEEFSALSGSTVNISGGTIGDRFRVDRGATANILGGTLDRFYVFDGGTVNIWGGRWASGFDALNGAVVNLFGARFLLNDMDITASLTPNVPLSISDRGVILHGLLADRSEFSFMSDYVRPGGTLTVTLVPEPNEILLTVCGLCALAGFLAARPHRI